MNINPHLFTKPNIKIENYEKSLFDTNMMNLESENKIKEDNICQYNKIININEDFEHFGEMKFMENNQEVESENYFRENFKICQNEEKMENELIRNLNHSSKIITHINSGVTVTPNENSSISMNSPHDVSNREKFIMKIREMRNQTDNYLEYIKTNFISYIENQKSHLSGCLTTIEDIFEMEQKSLQAEEAKNKTIDKKLEVFTKELNILLTDLQKFIK